MSDERLTGEAHGIPDGARLVPCPDCGELFFLVKLTGGNEVLTQPIVVRGIIPDVELVQGLKPTPEDQLIEKVVARTATGRLSPPILVPHSHVCIRAPLIRSVPPPVRVVPMGPDPKPGGVTLDKIPVEEGQEPQ